MVAEAQAHSQEDQRRREEVEARNSADSIAYQVERQLSELGDRVPPNEKARAEQLITQIRDLVKSQSTGTAQLRQLTSDLQQVAHGLSAAAYSQATSAGAQAGSPGGGRPSGGDDDVIDADFRPTG